MCKRPAVHLHSAYTQEITSSHLCLVCNALVSFYSLHSSRYNFCLNTLMTGCSSLETVTMKIHPCICFTVTQTTCFMAKKQKSSILTNSMKWQIYWLPSLYIKVVKLCIKLCMQHIFQRITQTGQFFAQQKHNAHHKQHKPLPEESTGIEFLPKTLNQKNIL